MAFRKIELTGATKEEAIKQAPFSILGDATQAYKNWRAKQTGAITEKCVKEFMMEYLTKKSKNVEGIGFSITVESAIADTRERPYKITDVRNEQGKRKYKTTYQLIDVATGKILAETEGTKTDAKNLAKKVITEQGFKGKMKCVYTKQVVGGEPIAFEAEYAPSVRTKQGVYLVFGNEA